MEKLRKKKMAGEREKKKIAEMRFFFNEKICLKIHFCPCQIELVYVTSLFLTEKLTEMMERTISENGGIIKVPR
ncbi:hypothetical protein PRUPE_1G153900 [Prunus persica]|uniref:Uncharacterized protein n=1 Tax=Prunus persica TaxID=3760 RepID=A0A251R0V0_PRUPE|nr:hypothetical protein PRUPE_1G153900 [Prunus persica]